MFDKNNIWIGICTVKVALYKNKLLRHIVLLNFNGVTSMDSL